MKKIMVLLISVLLLAGCSAKKEVSCVYTEEGFESKIVFVGEEDEVHSSSETIKILYEYVSGGEEDIKEQIKEQIETSYAGIDGVKVNVDITGEEYLVMTIDIDYQQASNDDLVALGILSSDESSADFISFEESISENEAYGYTCTVK